MWLKLVSFFLGLSSNATVKKIIMSLINLLVSSASTLIPEAMNLIKEANTNPDLASLSGFERLAYVANKLQEAHPDMAMSAIVNVITAVYDGFKDEISV
jgi:hypothetical protein